MQVDPRETWEMFTTVIAFLAYLVAVLLIGVWAAQKPQDTSAGIHLANREHGKWTTALSSSASTESGFVLLGMVGIGYTVGANALWIIPAGIFGYALNWFLLAPRLREKSDTLNAITLPELIAASTGNRRFSQFASMLAAVLVLVFLVAYVAAQFTAAGKTLSTQFGIPYWSSVLIAAGAVGLYAVLGGFRAISWTDNVQAILMLIALVLLPIVLLVKIGGVGQLSVRLQEIDPSLVSFTAGNSGWAAVTPALAWLMLGLGCPGQPHTLARLMAAKDKTIFRPGALIALTWYLLIYTGAVTLGMAARAGFADVPKIAHDPEIALPVLAAHVFPGALAGLTLAAIIAAVSSTADSMVFSAASTLVRDLRRVVYPKPLRHELTLTRIAIVLFLLIAVLFSLNQSGLVFDLVLYAWSGLGASLGPAVLYCCLATSPRALSAFTGIAVGAGCAFLLHDHDLDLLISFSVSLGAILLLHQFPMNRGTVRSC